MGLYGVTYRAMCGAAQGGYVWGCSRGYVWGILKNIFRLCKLLYIFIGFSLSFRSHNKQNYL